MYHIVVVWHAYVHAIALYIIALMTLTKFRLADISHGFIELAPGLEFSDVQLTIHITVLTVVALIKYRGT